MSAVEFVTVWWLLRLAAPACNPCLLSCSTLLPHNRGVAAGRQVCVHAPWHDVGGVAAGAADVCCGGGWRISREEAVAEAEGVGKERQQGVLIACR